VQYIVAFWNAICLNVALIAVSSHLKLVYSNSCGIMSEVPFILHFTYISFLEISEIDKPNM